jgi:hypothetical protein
MTDLHTFLADSWAKQVPLPSLFTSLSPSLPHRSSQTVTCILEALVTRYFKSVMKIQETAPPPTKTKERRLFVSSRDIKGMVDKMVVAGLRATPVTVALIQQDTDAIVKFFKQKTESTDQYSQVLVSLSSSPLDSFPHPTLCRLV